MITTSDIANILYTDCKSFGITTYQRGNVPQGDVTDERIVIYARSNTMGMYWGKSFVDVNFCVPDIGENVANLLRLNDIEREATARLSQKSGRYDGTCYRYSIDRIGIEADTALKCHYINVKLLFEILNVK